MDLIPENNYKIAVTHPAAAGYSGVRWNCDDLFNKVNKCLEAQSKSKIIW